MLTTPSLQTYSILFYLKVKQGKDLDSTIYDNKQILQPKITTFSYNFIAGGKAKCRLFFMFPEELVSKG